MKSILKNLKRKPFWTHTVVAVAAILIVITVEKLPTALGNRLLPSLVASAGIEGIEAKVNKLWFNGAELNRVRLLLNGKRTISVDTIRLQYSLPFWPFQRVTKIKSAIISGLRVNVVEENGKLIIPGLPEKWLDAKGEKKQTSSDAPLFTIQKIILRDSMIRFDRDGEVFEIPFIAYLNMPPESGKPFQLHGEVNFLGDKLKVRSQWQRDNGMFGLDLEGSFRSANYMRLFPQMQGKLRGVAAFNGHFTGLYKNGMKYPKNFAGTLNFTRFGFATGGARLGIKPETTLTLKVTDSEYEITGLQLTRPFKAEFEKITGPIILKNNNLTVVNNIMTKIIATENPQLNLPNDIVADYSGNIRWEIAQKNIFAVGRCSIPALQYGPLEVAGVSLEFDGVLKNGVPTVNAQVAIPALAMPKIKLKTGLIKLSAKWPLSRDKTNYLGDLQADGVALRDYKIDALDWQILLNHNNLSFKGTARQNILPETKFNNQIDITFAPELKVAAIARVSHPENASAINLRSFAPNIPALTFSGALELGGTWSWIGGKQNSAAEIMVQNGKIIGKDINLKAEGIDINTKAFIIPEIETPPLQNIGCRKLSFGKFVFENIHARFQVEHGKEFLLEDFIAEWCGGKVFTQSLRFNPNVTETRAVIYCDGLNLADILNQTGIAQAQGGGKLHGRLPLIFGTDGVNFESGFLYSVPGETKNIRLFGLKKKLDGIPPETSQYAQLDLASEALKDFDYEWIKLDFSSDGDYLTVNSQFNGRPNQPLPFTFDQGQGGFVRSKEQTAKFQGIKLDLNSSFPLNRLINLNKKMKQYFQRRTK